jgi:hypothetical protein
MKNTSRRNSKAPASVDADEILSEYDFSRSRPNKFASRYASDSLVVVLEPDVAAIFPTASQANEALRVLARLFHENRVPKASAPRKRRAAALRTPAAPGAARPTPR